MPIYEYHCSKCGNFEAMQKMSDKPLTQCPTCRRKVTKLISATSFQLKGSGWYITDYARKDSGKADAKQEKKGEEKTSEAGKTGDSKDAGSTTSSSETTSSGGDTSSGGKKSSGKSGKKSSEKAAAA